MLPPALHFSPRAPHGLDLEMFTFSALRQRVGAAALRGARVHEGYMMLCVTAGHARQWVDFAPVDLRRGSVLVVRPGQIHDLGPDTDWDCWIILFRREFLTYAAGPAYGDLRDGIGRVGAPSHLPDEHLPAVTGLLARMRDDIRSEAPSEELHRLLRCQLQELLLRVGLHAGSASRITRPSSRLAARFEAFHSLVEDRYASWHGAAAYADRLGCTGKTLSRAVAEIAGTTPKAYIAQRIVLEAKRLLIHTDLSVSAVSQRLGFPEPTDFGKFFKREASCSPAEFRRMRGLAFHRHDGRAEP